MPFIYKPLEIIFAYRVHAGRGKWRVLRKAKPLGDLNITNCPGTNSPVKIPKNISYNLILKNFFFKMGSRGTKRAII